MECGCGGAVAQLPVAVEPPAVRTPIVGECAGVLSAGTDGDEGVASAHRLGQRAALRLTRWPDTDMGRGTAELAAGVRAPAAGHIVRCNSARVRPAGADRSERVSAQDGTGDGGQARQAVAELTQ